MAERGFTLLELLFTLTIIVLLATVGLPSLTQQIHNNRTEAAALDFYAAVQLTRNTAITTNSRVTLRHLGSWQDGWEIFLDANHNGVRNSGEKLLRQHEEPGTQVEIDGNYWVHRYVSFIGTGESRRASGDSGGMYQVGTFTVCPEQGQGYALVLSRGGRMRMHRISQAKCDAV